MENLVVLQLGNNASAEKTREEILFGNVASDNSQNINYNPSTLVRYLKLRGRANFTERKTQRRILSSKISELKGKRKQLRHNRELNKFQREKTSYFDATEKLGTELTYLYREKREIQLKNKQAKIEYVQLRNQIFSECLALKNRRFGNSDLVIPDKGDPWQSRIPYMQDLFFTHNDGARKRINSIISEILSQPNCLENLRNFMDTVMSEAAVQPHVIDVPSIEATVRSIASPENIRIFLREILSSDNHLDQVINDSYHHDLFDKSVLLCGKKSAWKLRMHVFVPETFTIAQEEIHSHRNHFVSYCLYGGLSQELWEEEKDVSMSNNKIRKNFSDKDMVPETTQLFKYIYDPTTTSDGNTRVFNIKNTGKISLSRVQKSSVVKGQSYYMHPSVLHSVCAIDGCTVTLVWNSPHVTEKSCFATYSPWQSENFVRPKFTKEEMVKQLEMVLGLLLKPRDIHQNICKNNGQTLSQ